MFVHFLFLLRWTKQLAFIFLDKPFIWPLSFSFTLSLCVPLIVVIAFSLFVSASVYVSLSLQYTHTHTLSVSHLTDCLLFFNMLCCLILVAYRRDRKCFSCFMRTSSLHICTHTHTNIDIYVWVCGSVCECVCSVQNTVSVVLRLLSYFFLSCFPLCRCSEFDLFLFAYMRLF